MVRITAGWVRWLLLAALLTAGMGVQGAAPASAARCSIGSPLGACQLVFVSPGGEPSNAVVNTNITSQGFTPSGAPVEVLATDANGNHVNGVAVNLSLLPTGSGATLTLGGSAQVSSTTGTNGIATFGSSSSPLAINQTGYFQLQASATGYTPAASTGFQIVTKVCTASSTCSTPGKKGDQASITAINSLPTDLLTLGAGGLSYSCTGYTTVSDPFSADVWDSNGVTIDSSASGQVVLTISKSLVKQSPNQGASQFQICYASTATFTTRSGAAPAIITAQGGLTLYVGLLADCPNGASSTPVPPCVVSRTKDNAGDVLITYLGTGDFWGQG